MFSISIFSWNPFVLLKQNLAFMPEEYFEEPTTSCTPKMKHVTLTKTVCLTDNTTYDY